MPVHPSYLLSAACAHTNLAVLLTCKLGDEDTYSSDADSGNNEQPVSVMAHLAVKV